MFCLLLFQYVNILPRGIVGAIETTTKYKKPNAHVYSGEMFNRVNML